MRICCRRRATPWNTLHKPLLLLLHPSMLHSLLLLPWLLFLQLLRRRRHRLATCVHPHCRLLPLQYLPQLSSAELWQRAVKARP